MKNFFLIITAMLMFSACKKESYPILPDYVSDAIHMSGRNYIEMMDAVVTYSDSKDSLKLQSLFYLIGHLPDHGYRTYLLQDSLGVLIDYNIKNYKTYDFLLESKDTIISKHGPLHFFRHYYGMDLFKMKSDLLIDQVERSFSVWDRGFQGARYSFEMYQENILPSRLNCGPLDRWKTIVADTLLPNYSHTDVFMAANEIVDTVCQIVKYDPRFVENPTDQGWSEIRQFGYGRTEDMATVSCAALRTYGIAAAIDFIPVPQEIPYTASYWLSVWNPQGERQTIYPSSEHLHNPTTYPKVFRRTYFTYHDILPKDSIYLNLRYHHLENGKFKDVTDEYLNTTTLSIPKEEVTAVSPFSRVFLSVWYQNQWIPVDWRYFNDDLYFRKVAKGFHYALTDREGAILYQVSL